MARLDKFLIKARRAKYDRSCLVTRLSIGYTVSNLTISRWDTRGSQRKLFPNLFSNLLFLTFFFFFYFSPVKVLSSHLSPRYSASLFDSSGKNRVERKVDPCNVRNVEFFFGFSFYRNVSRDCDSDCVKLDSM